MLAPANNTMSRVLPHLRPNHRHVDIACGVRSPQFIRDSYPKVWDSYSRMKSIRELESVVGIYL